MSPYSFNFWGILHSGKLTPRWLENGARKWEERGLSKDPCQWVRQEWTNPQWKSSDVAPLKINMAMENPPWMKMFISYWKWGDSSDRYVSLPEGTVRSSRATYFDRTNKINGATKYQTRVFVNGSISILPNICDDEFTLGCSQIPIGCIYDIFTYIWLIWMVNFGKCRQIYLPYLHVSIIYLIPFKSSMSRARWPVVFLFLFEELLDQLSQGVLEASCGSSGQRAAIPTVPARHFWRWVFFFFRLIPSFGGDMFFLFPGG